MYVNSIGDGVDDVRVFYQFDEWPKNNAYYKLYDEMGTKIEFNNSQTLYFYIMNEGNTTDRSVTVYVDYSINIACTTLMMIFLITVY